MTLINFCFLAFVKNECKPIYCGQYQIGLVRPSFEAELVNYPEVFRISTENIRIIDGNDLSARVDRVFAGYS